MQALEELTGHAEEVLRRLGLRYRVLAMGTGDMGFAQYKKYDAEAWAPGMERWLEVSSCAVFADFQARRASVRFRPERGAPPQHCHTMNGRALRLAPALEPPIEPYQQPA